MPVLTFIPPPSSLLLLLDFMFLEGCLGSSSLWSESNLPKALGDTIYLFLHSFYSIIYLFYFSFFHDCCPSICWKQMTTFTPPGSHSRPEDPLINLGCLHATVPSRPLPITKLHPVRFSRAWTGWFTLVFAFHLLSNISNNGLHFVRPNFYGLRIVSGPKRSPANSLFFFFFFCASLQCQKGRKNNKRFSQSLYWHS